MELTRTVAGEGNKDMSHRFRSSSMQLASLPDTQGSQLLDSARGIARLFWIEFRRCGGFWLLPVILPLVWFMNRYQVDDRVVLWHRMSIVTFQSYVIIGPLTAGLGAWLAGRDRRRRTGGLIETAPTRPYRRDLLLLTAAAAWGIVAYVVVAVWFLGRAVLFATWGGPALSWLAIGALAIMFHAALGLVIGRVIRGRFAALVAVALPIAFAIGADTYRRTTEVDLGGDIGWVTNSEQPLRVLSPFSLSLSFGQDAGIVKFGDGQSHDSLLWLAGLLGVTLAATGLLHRRRSLIGMAGLGVSLIVATLGAQSLLGVSDWYGDGESPVLPFEWSCRTGSGIEVCLHPAYEARLDDVTATMGKLVAPVAGLPGVPVTWQQSLPTGDSRGKTVGVGLIHSFDDYTLVSSLADVLFITDHRERNASQFLVITALAEEAGVSDQWDWPYGWPSEVTITEGEGFHGPDEGELAVFEPRFDAAVDRFVALGPEQQRAWLETNWDALRAGELTLEDMP